MFILPHHLFDVTIESEGFIKFIPLENALNIISHLLNATSVCFHGYKRRHIKQPGLPEIVVLIPRIKVEGSFHNTHVLLPEFILPYCRYTAKSLAMISEGDIQTEARYEISQKEWDKCINIVTKKAYRKIIYYLNFRKP